MSLYALVQDALRLAVLRAGPHVSRSFGGHPERRCQQARDGVILPYTQRVCLETDNRTVQISAYLGILLLIVDILVSNYT